MAWYVRMNIYAFVTPEAPNALRDWSFINFHLQHSDYLKQITFAMAFSTYSLHFRGKSMKGFTVIHTQFLRFDTPKDNED